MGDDELEYSPQHVVFRDVFLLLAFGFVAIVILLIPWINPPAVANKEDLDTEVGIIVEISWPSLQNTDVDLWVKAPNDQPVGYSNLGAQLFNLLRDDLGYANDYSYGNNEIAQTRGVRAGEYIVNLHMYSASNNFSWPIPVRVKVSIKSNLDAKPTLLLQGEFMLTEVGQELTVYRFSLDEHNNLISDSVNNFPIGIRSFTTGRIP